MPTDQWFQVLEVLPRATGGNDRQHVALARGRGAELAEGGEEVVVAALPTASGEALHGPSPHHVVVERPVGPGVGGGPLPGPTRRRGGDEGGRVDAQAVVDRQCEEAFGRDGTGQMGVEVAALGQLPKEGTQSAGLVPDLVEVGVDPLLDGGRGAVGSGGAAEMVAPAAAAGAVPAVPPISAQPTSADLIITARTRPPSRLPPRMTPPTCGTTPTGRGREHGNVRNRRCRGCPPVWRASRRGGIAGAAAGMAGSGTGAAGDAAGSVIDG